MRKLVVTIALALVAIGLAQQPGRSIVSQVILPGPPYKSSAATTINQVKVLNQQLLRARSECGTYESVYWSGRILSPTASAIKQDVISQMTNRRWAYTVFDRSTEAELFHLVSPDENQIIVGGWIQVNNVLTLVWCNGRPL